MILKTKYRTTIAVGDPHAEPGNNNDRFTALGNFIAETQPDNIVQMGDFMTLDSISTHNTKVPLKREGLRLVDDLEAGMDAYQRMMVPTRVLNKTFTKNKKKKYTPGLQWLNGNHEDRVMRYISEAPELLGLVDTNLVLNLEADGWSVHKYREYAFVEGVGFTHIPMNKRVNQPIGGEYVARRAADMHAFDVVFGHTHRLGIHGSKRQGAAVNYGINCGWFGDFPPEYVKGNEENVDWWEGIVHLTHTDAGVMVMPIPMAVLKKDYL